jgi:hypothetical protein
MIFPDDELLDEVIVSDYVPTYYPSTIQWVNAGQLYADANLVNVNINVFKTKFRHRRKYDCKYKRLCLS